MSSSAATNAARKLRHSSGESGAAQSLGSPWRGADQRQAVLRKASIMGRIRAAVTFSDEGGEPQRNLLRVATAKPLS